MVDADAPPGGQVAGRWQVTLVVKASVQVDIQFAPDGQHTLALMSDVTPAVGLKAGDLVAAGTRSAPSAGVSPRATTEQGATR